jgi:hypothetical protein
MIVRTISGAATHTVYHNLWREKTPLEVRNGMIEANKRLFSKNSKKVGEKYMKVVTNGGMWCILTVCLGEVYPIVGAFQGKFPVRKTRGVAADGYYPPLLTARTDPQTNVIQVS